MKLKITETNMLAILNVKAGGIRKTEVAMGGRYHISLQMLCKFKLVEYSKETYTITAAGKKQLASTSTKDGTDARSKMQLKK